MKYYWALLKLYILCTINIAINKWNALCSDNATIHDRRAFMAVIVIFSHVPRVPYSVVYSRTRAEKFIFPYQCEKKQRKIVWQLSIRGDADWEEVSSSVIGKAVVTKRILESLQAPDARRSETKASRLSFNWATSTSRRFEPQSLLDLFYELTP